MKVAIAGPRNMNFLGGNVKPLNLALGKILSLEPEVVLHGGADGIDKEMVKFITGLNIPTKEYYPEMIGFSLQRAYHKQRKDVACVDLLMSVHPCKTITGVPLQLLLRTSLMILDCDEVVVVGPRLESDGLPPWSGTRHTCAMAKHLNKNLHYYEATN